MSAVSLSNEKRRERRAAVLLASPALLLLTLLFALPLALLLAVSLQGPSGLSLAAYQKLFGQSYYLLTIGHSLGLALSVTALSFLIGYPASFAIARAKGVWQSLALGCLFLPLAASVIVKAFAWTILLRSSGVINASLLWLGVIDAPIRMIFTQTALIVGAVNIFLPFMVLPLYAVVAQLDPRLPEAAATLGASPLVAFVKVTVPATLPGIVAGVALVFSLAVSAYVVPSLLIGEKFPTLASTIAKAYLLTQDKTFGAAAGVVLLAIALVVVVVSGRMSREAGA